jgi:G3E family GTPase
MASVASDFASPRRSTFANVADHSSTLGSADGDTRLPVLVITGFLGSGKTTLLNRLLTQAAMRGSAVAINEFGEVGIDGDLVEPHAPGPQAILAGGCFCCSLSASFGDELLSLYHRAAGSGQAIDRLVIEMTGIGEPADLIGFIIGNPVGSQLLRLETIVCTVDALFAHQYIDEYPEAAAQIAIADVLVITKSDLAEAGSVDRLAEVLPEINPRAKVIIAPLGNISADELLLSEHRTPSIGDPVANPPAGGGHRHHQGELAHGVMTFTLHIDRPLDRRLFLRWLASVKVSQGRSLLRTKGIVYYEGEPKPFVVQGVQHVFNVTAPVAHLTESGSRSRMMFIVKDAVADDIKASWDELVQATALKGKDVPS